MRTVFCGYRILDVHAAGGIGIPHAVHRGRDTWRAEYTLPDRECPSGMHGNRRTRRHVDYAPGPTAVLFAAMRSVHRNRLPAGRHRRFLKHFYAEHDFEFSLQRVSSKSGEAVLKGLAIY